MQNFKTGRIFDLNCTVFNNIFYKFFIFNIFICEYIYVRFIY